jgi:hypothetical protein
MDNQDTTDQASQAPPAQLAGERVPRLPSWRASAILAAVMLALGVAVGAAIGPSPATSLAGGASLVSRLPALLAALDAQHHPAASTASPPEATREARPRHKRHRRHATPVQAAIPATTTTPASEPSTPTTGGSTHKTKLPAVGTVWLIELAGGTIEAALAAPTAAPYLDGQAVHQGTLLSGWSAVQGSAFATDAVLTQAPASGSPPPLLHTIVQPPCPEGQPQCASETPGQLTAADEFLKATLAQITTTAAYREHGLVVITFATVAIATQGGLPAGAASATLTTQPPGGVLLLSPLAHAGLRSTATFDPTSPAHSLERLLR